MLQQTPFLKGGKKTQTGNVKAAIYKSLDHCGVTCNQNPYRHLTKLEKTER